MINYDVATKKGYKITQNKEYEVWFYDGTFYLHSIMYGRIYTISEAVFAMIIANPECLFK